ncbi:DUF2306 domain-containing protein [Muricauda sp. 2012CJ35-5]|uniref:DUF2306 domain-containing protein n=1 Tax=Flagellimonas spongiicola TaxID=2942208 RepID=A0ABT0PNM2_9FLAO|nr:DUF2306 domain-containing protein [Allomuricauda spongiicola]MCL6272990.1 DUF2306 domain-containing protein [Allomuricauda spongiicola]
MSTINKTSLVGEKRTIWSNALLDKTSKIWFIVTVLGQWIFAAYVALFYGGAAMDGDFMKWNRVLPHGYVEGETMGNLAVATHLLFAVIVLFGGPMQFIPQLRKKIPTLHRWSGRFYITAAFLLSLSGIYMVIAKGTISGLVGDISVSLNGILILLFAVLALRTAMKRDFLSHSQWVMRLFLAMGGVWFFRIGLMFWLFVNGGPVGFDMETFRGPFLVFLGFGQYIIPLAVYELYRISKRKTASNLKAVMFVSLVVFTLITALGTFAATMGMWIPRIS